MGINFHETGYGKRFFDKQLPDLIKALNRLAEAKEIQPSKESPKQTEETYDRLRAIMENKEMAEKLGETFREEVMTDDEKTERIGHYLAKAILDDSVEDLLIALCGWGCKSLLNLAEFGVAYPKNNNVE